MKGRATREFLSSARIRCCPHRIQTEDPSIKGLKKKKEKSGVWLFKEPGCLSFPWLAQTVMLISRKQKRRRRRGRDALMVSGLSRLMERSLGRVMLSEMVSKWSAFPYFSGLLMSSEKMLQEFVLWNVRLLPCLRRSRRAELKESLYSRIPLSVRRRRRSCSFPCVTSPRSVLVAEIRSFNWFIGNQWL